MDDSTFNDDGGTVELPDGLLQFRLNLVEVLVDICQLLKSGPVIQKVLTLGNHAVLKLLHHPSPPPGVLCFYVGQQKSFMRKYIIEIDLYLIYTDPIEFIHD